MAMSIVESMKLLASKGKTIVCTIHQPSSEIFQMFDRLCLLSEGRLAYLGDMNNAIHFFSSFVFFFLQRIHLDLSRFRLFLYSQGFNLPLNYNPADYFIKILAVVPQDKEKCLDTINVIFLI